MDVASAPPPDDSGSSSDSSDSDSSKERRRDRRHEQKKREKKERKREKREKREKRDRKKEKNKKEKKHKKKRDRDDSEVRRSIITGKRIKTQQGEVADAEGEARRALILAQVNEGEADEAPWAKKEVKKSELDELKEKARYDPALMKELMLKGQQAQRERERKMGRMVASEARLQYLADVLEMQRAQGLR